MFILLYLTVQEAKIYLNYLALRPFEAVSYILGAQEFHRLKVKYQKQLGKKFDLLTFHTKVLSVGRVPLKSLEEVLEKTYKIYLQAIKNLIQ